MTYKVAILDDEELMREGITLKYPFTENGFEIVFSGEDGNVLLQAIANNKLAPDLVFVDIQMPRLNGLEFIRKLRNASPKDIEIVIVSGHDNFAYAQQAIRLSVTEYLLKPLDPQELAKVMEKIKYLLENKTTQQIELIHDEIAGWLLSRGKAAGLSATAAAFVENLLRERPHAYVALFGNLQSMTPEYEGIRAFFADAGDFDISSPGICNLFVHFDRSAHFADEVFRQFTFPTITIARLGPAQSRDSLPESIAYGVSWLQYKLTLGKRIYEHLQGGFWENEKLVKINPEHRAALQMFAKKMQQENKFAELHHFLQMDIPQSLKETALQQFARETLQLEIASDWLQQFDRPDEFVEECMYLIQKSQETIKPSKGRDILQCVLKDLASEYHLNLTMKDYADRYHIHTNHLVRLFKQEIQSTYYQTVTGIKMEKAKSALIHSDQKVHEIAADLGYEDPRYFAQVFRKHNQMTPIEFRKRYQKC